VSRCESLLLLPQSRRRERGRLARRPLWQIA